MTLFQTFALLTTLAMLILSWRRQDKWARIFTTILSLPIVLLWLDQLLDLVEFSRSVQLTALLLTIFSLIFISIRALVVKQGGAFNRMVLVVAAGFALLAIAFPILHLRHTETIYTINILPVVSYIAAHRNRIWTTHEYPYLTLIVLLNLNAFLKIAWEVLPYWFM